MATRCGATGSGHDYSMCRREVISRRGTWLTFTTGTAQSSYTHTRPGQGQPSYVAAGRGQGPLSYDDNSSHYMYFELHASLRKGDLFRAKNEKINFNKVTFLTQFIDI